MHATEKRTTVGSGEKTSSIFVHRARRRNWGGIGWNPKKVYK
jgi:hypothetical protein